MTNQPLDSGPEIDVAVIGGGPSGLAAATALKMAGVARVVVLERDTDAGGIPRHCGHPPFGMREFKRILTGPKYAARLVDRAVRAGVEIHTNTSVIEARQGGELLVAVPAGLLDLTPRRVIFATGVRETPRSAQFISGARVQGVMNTGALQSMVFLQNRRPFRRPVIIGTELVAFSALMTSRHAKIRPVAMLESNPRVTSRWPSAVFPRLVGVALHTNTKLLEIKGNGAAVCGVIVEGKDGQTRDIDCDGVVFSGQFTPESTLARSGHLTVDPATGGPVVDAWGRCSDPVYFATGNVLRPVETAGWSWNEGRMTGLWVADDLAGKLPDAASDQGIELLDPRLKYVMPQVVGPLDKGQGMLNLQLRVSQSVNGVLVVRAGEKTIWKRKISTHPERRILIPLAPIATSGGPVTIDILDINR